MIGTAVDMNWDYVAGFFEADGWAGIFHNYENKKYYSVRIQITQKIPEILHKIQRFLLENNIKAIIYRRPDRNAHDLTITDKTQASRFCEAIYPHLHTLKKKEQILTAYGSTALQTKLNDKLIRER